MDELQVVIDREEAWLARRIGPLSGERTEHFVVTNYSQIIQLKRPTSAVVVTDDDAVELDGVELINEGWMIWRPNVQWPAMFYPRSHLHVTYMPNDEDEVKRGIIDLTRLTVNSSQSEGKQQETIGSYSYTLGSDTNATGLGPARKAVVRSLSFPRKPTTVHVRSTRNDLAWPDA